MFSPTELLWAAIGLLLTIGGTLLEASMTSPPWNWGQSGISTFSLGVTYQVGAVLLVACLGGKNAGAISQIAYLVLGLTNLSVFTQGGGINYIQQPTFGYLLGFVPGAWLCGFLAFRKAPKLENLAFSCVCGLGIIHLMGIIYLILKHYLRVSNSTFSLWSNVLYYSFYALPGQLALVCTVAVLAFFWRRLMFY